MKPCHSTARARSVKHVRLWPVICNNFSRVPPYMLQHWHPTDILFLINQRYVFFSLAHTPADTPCTPYLQPSCSDTSFNLSFRSVVMSAAPPKKKPQKKPSVDPKVVLSTVCFHCNMHKHTHTRPPAIFISRREQPVESAPDWVQEWSRSSEQEGQQGFKRW